MFALLLPDLRLGGAERISLDLAHEFARRGVRVEFVLMQARGELLEDACTHFPVVGLGISRARQVLGALADYLRRRRPDGLIAAIWPLTVLAPVAARLAGHRCRVVISEHGMLSAQYRDWGVLHGWTLRGSTAAGYRLADRRLAVSNGVANDLARLSGMPRSAFDVVYNPVPIRPVPSAQQIVTAEQLWSAPRGARILSVGRFKAVKNHPLLLRAFAQLDIPEARLMLVGNGENAQAVRRLAGDLGIAERVIFAGFQSDPTPFYVTADLFVLSSNYEGFGNVIVESLACGTPVVSTDCPSGPAEILEDNRYGRLVPVGDVAALAQGMAATLEERPDLSLLQRRARDFSPERAAAQYLAFLQMT